MAQILSTNLEQPYKWLKQITGGAGGARQSGGLAEGQGGLAEWLWRLAACRSMQWPLELWWLGLRFGRGEDGGGRGEGEAGQELARRREAITSHADAKPLLCEHQKIPSKKDN